MLYQVCLAPHDPTAELTERERLNLEVREPVPEPWVVEIEAPTSAKAIDIARAQVDGTGAKVAWVMRS